MPFIKRRPKIKPKIPLFLFESLFLLRDKDLEDYYQKMWDEQLFEEDRIRLIWMSNEQYRRFENLERNNRYMQIEWNNLPHFLKNDLIDTIDYFRDITSEEIPASAMILNLLSRIPKDQLLKLWERKDSESITSILILEYLYLNQQSDMNYIVEIIDHIDSNVSPEFRFHKHKDNIRDTLNTLENEGYIRKEKKSGRTLSYDITQKGINHYLTIREGVAKTLKEELSIPIIINSGKIGTKTFKLITHKFRK
jgi:DNA-binding PadR family transcriptional regulator